MRFEAWHLFAISALYLGLLFVIATAAEKKWLPDALIKHPLVYTLSLGVYATSWTYYGSVGLADREGYAFLGVYMGLTIAFLASPILLRPILRLVKKYQLSSLADLLAFRYNSQLAGVLVTLFMLAGTLPYTALQIQAVTESLRILTGGNQPLLLSLGFCLTISLFAILFGSRHVRPREKHEGLVVAIAFESLVKLAAILAVGLYAVFGIFDGPAGFSNWVRNNPAATEALMQPIQEGAWAMMLLLSFSAAFLLPRQFHMIFVENIRSSNLDYASWAFPLFLLLLNIAIPPILWVGQSMDLSYGPDLYVLGVSMQSQSVLLPVFIFIGGISAASAMIIVTSIALATMCLNHLFLPLSFARQTRKQVDLYRMLIVSKSLIILLIILAGYVFYLFLQTHRELADLGLISFVAVAQFLPAIFGLLFWKRASRSGFIAGLIVGGTIWFCTQILPLFTRAGWIENNLLELIIVPMSSTTSAVWSLMFNGLTFAIVSLLLPQKREEAEAAEACLSDDIYRPPSQVVAASIEQFEQQLRGVIGESMAKKEVALALRDLNLEREALTRNDLNTLRVQIGHNLSGLLGPVMSSMIVNENLHADHSAQVAIADTIKFVERSLDDSRTELKAMAGELDALRRFHRQGGHDLPLAVVTISPELEVVSWNGAMQVLSGKTEAQVLGLHINALSSPWGRLIDDFVQGSERFIRQRKIHVKKQMLILNLHKSIISGRQDDPQKHAGGYVVLIEDHSEVYQLESELAHSERLASIGQLATGVAHEIGNPVTGIACLAQEIQEMPNDKQLMKEGVKGILELTDRISKIVQSLVNYSHVDHENPDTLKPVNLRDTVDQAIKLVSLSHKGKQIRYINHCQRDTWVVGDAQQLAQVFVILLSNACDASEGKSEVYIEESRDRLSHQRIKVSVIDHGRGIEPYALQRIFDPFYTTKQVGEGTGVGLSLAYSILQKQGGQISVKSKPGEGSEFILQITLADQPPKESDAWQTF